MPKTLLRRELLPLSDAAFPAHREGQEEQEGQGRNDEQHTETRLTEPGHPTDAEVTVQKWLEPLDITWNETDGRLEVDFPHRFFATRFESLFRRDFEQAARRAFGADMTFSYRIAGENAMQSGNIAHSRQTHNTEETPPETESRTRERPAPPTGVHPALGNPFPFGEDRTFDTFISNGKHRWTLGLARELVRRAIHMGARGTGTRAFAEPPGLLLLCGAPGTGKSHLLHAIGNDLFRVLGNDVCLISMDELTESFVNVPGPDARLNMRRRLGDKRALLVDDMQRLNATGAIPGPHPSYSYRPPSHGPHTGHEDDRPRDEQPPLSPDPAAADPAPSPEHDSRTEQQPAWQGNGYGRYPAPQPASYSTEELQNELCLLLDRFLEQGKAVVLAGAGHPGDWRLSRGLFSRMEMGLWAELPEPDLDVRLRYAQQQARLRRMPLSKELLLLLSQHCQDIRRLSGLIRRVASHRALLGREISAQDIMNIIRQGSETSALSPQMIISIVGEHCGVPTRDILGEKRRPDLVHARQMAMYLCRELLGQSYPLIGRMFGGKDHSTVMHSVKKIKQLQEHDRLVHTMVTELTKACRERLNWPHDRGQCS